MLGEKGDVLYVLSLAFYGSYFSGWSVFGLIHRVSNPVQRSSGLSVTFISIKEGLSGF